VCIAGRAGVFLVVWVDRERQEVDLIPLHHATEAEVSVPFHAIRPADGEMAAAAAD